MKIRLHIFNFFDAIKGNFIRKHLKEISTINENTNENEIIDFQQLKLNQLLAYTNKNIPFYKTEITSLENAPIVNKTILKNNLSECVSVKYDKNELIKVMTSGSTGTPFVCYQNKEKKYRNNADAIYFGEKAGYKLGQILFYLKIWSANNKKSLLTRFMQNIYSIDVINFSGDAIKSFLSRLNKIERPVHINSYASALERLCNYLETHKLNLNKSMHVQSIIAQSEALPPDVKKKLKYHFKIDACSRYSNVENGVIAQQTLQENEMFKINRASYFVEIINMNNDEPVENGGLGRIVVTDLYNFAMPFIRYDTGDVGKFHVGKNNKINRNYITEIQGRKLDLLLNTKGEVISSYIMYKNMFKYPEIDQYQLIQQDLKSYEFVINIKGKFLREKEIKSDFLTYLGDDAVFILKYVDDIPLLASGKRRKIVNNYLKKKSVK